MIEIKNVTKQFGQHLAVDNVDFTVKEGEVVGFLGPNGAGKSTTMNIITGYISATEGTVKVDGYDILENPEEVKKRIGYLPEFPPLYVDMTVNEYLDFVYAIKKADPKAKEEDMKKIKELVGVVDVEDRLIKNLSKGYKQRVGLAQALIGNPPVLILDEPTVGLDPKQIIEIRNLIKELGRKHTIILSSHILPEVSAVCERLIIINEGKIVASDTPDNLSKRLGDSSKMTLRVAAQEKQALRVLRDIAGVKYVEAQGIKEPDTIDLWVEADKDIDIRRPIFNALSQAGYPILQMKSMDLTLEDIFLQVTTDEKGEVS